MSAPPKGIERSLQLLAEINRLGLRAFQTKKPQALIFLILNDTVPIARYDQAMLWKIRKGKRATLLGVSGQVTFSKTSDQIIQKSEIIQSLTEPEKPQIIRSPNIPETTSVLWLPIVAHEKPALGFWLERWNGVPWQQEEVEVLLFLMQSYGIAWERFAPHAEFKEFLKRFLVLSGVALVCALLLIKIPLRVVAPCEIVPKDPVVITAPLEGIIEKIVATPGQLVTKGMTLVEYDKRVPMQELRIEQKKVEISQSEVDRLTAEAEKDKKALAELGVEALKLRKEQLELGLAQYHASQLNIDAPIEGVAVIDNPETWHGKPVKIGEKILLIADPNQTKIRFWVPEGDNVVLDYKKPITVFLNKDPEKNREAKIIYISSYTHVTDRNVVSFVGEAEWTEPPTDIKLGLKGTAILYGENVTLFYWIIRKPLAYLRWTLGI